MKDSTANGELPAVLVQLVALFEAHRSVFRQERTYLRAMALLLAELFTFARHTVTQGLLALGLVNADWSAWYRLFSGKRFAEESLSACFFEQTLQHVPEQQPYVIGCDATQIARSSNKMPGTSWLKAPRTPAFKVGIHRAQRFEHIAWLTPREEGYSRAIPLRFLPAFPEKAVPAEEAPCREWEAGLRGSRWVHGQLVQAGRAEQLLLILGDGQYDTLELWAGLPANSVLAARTARNRCLYALPTPHQGRGRPREYGERAPTPAAWLHVRDGWQETALLVRGRNRSLRYRVEGPFVREGLPGCPLFLIVVRGKTWHSGKRVVRKRYREPAFYLISAVQREGKWQLPLEVTEVLAWLWQRWELEVTHREMKSGLGVGEKQCWGARSTVLSVQWGVWVYAMLVLAGYRAWGLLNGPRAPARWWPGANRWSLNTLWRSYRAALWGVAEFQATWPCTRSNWLQNDTWLAALWNSVLGTARA